MVTVKADSMALKELQMVEKMVEYMVEKMVEKLVSW